MRRVKSSWLPMLGALAALIVVSGCATSGGKTSTPGPDLAKSQVLHFALPTGGSIDIATLDPDIVADPNSQMVINLLFDPLVTLDSQMAVEQWGADRLGSGSARMG